MQPRLLHEDAQRARKQRPCDPSALPLGIADGPVIDSASVSPTAPHRRYAGIAEAAIINSAPASQAAGPRVLHRGMSR